MPLAFPKDQPTRQRVAHRQQRAHDLTLAKREVWQRDGYRCRICGRAVSNRGPLESRGHVHHLVARSRSKALRAVTSNLLLTCALCHADLHAYRIVVTGNANGTVKVQKGAAA